MKRHLLGVALLLSFCAAAALLNYATADEKKPDPKKVDEKKVDEKKEKPKPIESTIGKAESAGHIDFSKALGLSFDSLARLGTCIDEARRESDPVALANDANYLAAAEAASGKKAHLTAEALMKEAVELAKVRNNSAELKAVAALTKNEGVAKDLHSHAEKAAKHEAEDLAKFKSGEKTRGIANHLTVINNTDSKLFVYVNGQMIGFVNATRAYEFTVTIGDAPSEVTMLTARTPGGQTASRSVSGAVSDYYWTINP